MIQPSNQDTDALERPVPEIVVVDDEPGVLHMLLLQLTGAGPTRGFVDPIDALMWMSDAEPCCVIVDLKIPGVDGLDLISAFTSMRRHAVIVISAYISVSDTVAAMQLGCRHVFQKPASSDKLLEVVESALAGQPATDEAVRAAAAGAAEGTNPPSDLNGDSDYRRHLAGVLTRRAVLTAAGA